MGKEMQRRLISALKILRDPTGSTIPALIKAMRKGKPEISLKSIVQTLKGCLENGILTESGGRIRLRYSNGKLDKLAASPVRLGGSVEKANVHNKTCPPVPLPIPSPGPAAKIRQKCMPKSKPKSKSSKSKPKCPKPKPRSPRMKPKSKSKCAKPKRKAKPKPKAKCPKPRSKCPKKKPKIQPYCKKPKKCPDNIDM